MNKVDHPNVIDSFKKKALIPSNVCGESNYVKKFKSFKSHYDDILMNNLSSKIREIALTSENSKYLFA